MKVHLFSWKTIRGNNDINVLWELFGQVKEGKVDERLFQTALNIKSVGKGKLSIVLFYANPEKYVPLDSNTSSYLRSKKLGYTYDSFASYNGLSEKIVKTLGNVRGRFHTRHIIIHRRVIHQVLVASGLYSRNLKMN